MITAQMIIMIALDLYDPDQCIGVLKSWLHTVHSFIKERHEQSKSTGVSVSVDHSGDKSDSTSRHLVTYLKQIRLHKGDVRSILSTQTVSPSTVDSDAISDELKFIVEHFNIPIIVIGCHSEHIVLDSNASIRKHRELQGSLRSICMDIGASLVYTGATPIHPIQSTATSTSNHNVLRRYIIHRLYPELVPMELSIDVSLYKTHVS